MDIFSNQKKAKTLIAVSNDEIYLNQLKKLVETNDDEEGNVIGTTDGSVNIVMWNEKVWLDQKKTGKINNKVLFIDDVKGMDTLLPLVDIKFDRFGVKYGWAGNQAALWIDSDALKDHDSYNEFYKELVELPIPENLKESINKQEVLVVEGNQLLGNLAKLGKNTVASIKDNRKNKKILKSQMCFYGIINLYNNDLEEFMNS